MRLNNADLFALLIRARDSLHIVAQEVKQRAFDEFPAQPGVRKPYYEQLDIEDIENERTR